MSVCVKVHNNKKKKLFTLYYDYCQYDHTCAQAEIAGKIVQAFKGHEDVEDIRDALSLLLKGLPDLGLADDENWFDEDISDWELDYVTELEQYGFPGWTYEKSHGTIGVTPEIQEWMEYDIDYTVWIDLGDPLRLIDLMDEIEYDEDDGYEIKSIPRIAWKQFDAAHMDEFLKLAEEFPEGYYSNDPDDDYTYVWD